MGGGGLDFSHRYKGLSKQRAILKLQDPTCPVSVE